MHALAVRGEREDRDDQIPPRTRAVDLIPHLLPPADIYRGERIQDQRRRRISGAGEARAAFHPDVDPAVDHERLRPAVTDRLSASRSALIVFGTTVGGMVIGMYFQT